MYKKSVTNILIVSIQNAY